ncbi:hypothetical protein [Isoalcanivorax indicus]|uniref:hypothetical protein n=1 Tax=Isoalcanivorax indicus TaxID=2202653 RepID=UPI0013C46387|nr:hypothetical protein [Isoalcanivorax indicus]
MTTTVGSHRSGRRLLCIFLCLFTLPAWADSPIYLAGQYTLLITEASMMNYDVDNDSRADQVRDRLESLDPEMQQWLATLPAAERTRLGDDWRGLRKAMLGDNDGAGLVHGYDGYLQSVYTLHRDSLRRALLQAADEEAEGDLSETCVQMMRILASYMNVAANPFGGFALSFEDKDTDLARLVTEMDAHWERLLRQETVPTVRSAHTKWQFIRSSILRATEESLPFIVSYQSRQILAQLGDEMGLSIR